MRNRMIVRWRNTALAILTLFCFTVLFLGVDLVLTNDAGTKFGTLLCTDALAANDGRKTTEPKAIKVGLRHVRSRDTRINPRIRTPFPFGSQPEGRFFLPSAVRKMTPEASRQPPLNSANVKANSNAKAGPVSKVGASMGRKNKHEHETVSVRNDLGT